MKKIILIFHLLTINLVVFGAKQDTLRVMFIGNSYTYYNNLIQMVSLISDSVSTKLLCKKSTIGAAKLREHWNEERDLKSKSLVEKGQFDIVIIQDHSLSALEQPDSLIYFGNKFCSLVKSKGAKPYFYNTWARKNTPETQGIINKYYNDVSTNCGAVNINVGSCWQEVIKHYPKIELYHQDGSHPSSLGTFLTALAIVKKITGELPKQLPNVFNYYDKDGETFRIMQVSNEEIQLFKNIVESIN